jgi:hypothetical protein
MFVSCVCACVHVSVRVRVRACVYVRECMCSCVRAFACSCVCSVRACEDMVIIITAHVRMHMRRINTCECVRVCDIV